MAKKGQEDAPTLDIKHKRTGTVVSFIYPEDDWKTVSDIQYWNDNGKRLVWGNLSKLRFDEENRKC
ncbi:MAG: hypothetical protein H6601_02160 [Flavobacteriales bacterium]|nr:hypothetical protein [Flavobacteriales bacterium]